MSVIFPFLKSHQYKIIDLSLDIYDRAPTMPLDPKCALIVHHTIETMGYNITQMIISTHGTTHIDAPFHFFNDGLTVDEINLSKCIGEALLIDLSNKREKEEVLVKDLKKFDAFIFKESRIIIRTDWDKNFPDEKYFHDYPFLTTEAVEYLIGKEVSLLGIDTPGLNPKDYAQVHKKLLGNNIVIVEALANLDQIMSEKFFFIGLPLRIKGRDGSPIRAIGCVSEET
ncbi:MAG: cyclase family protein [Actinobacteria bacterium]|nr:cyclase family protein [Actinomycetota bacterium]